MSQLLKVESVNTYVEYVGAEVLHPLVGVIHFDELSNVHSSLNNYGVYGLFMQKSFPENLIYGVINYEASDDSLVAVAPGQLGGIPDDGNTISLSGWVLLFHPDFIRGTELERKMSTYHFFSYTANEALRLEPEEKDVLIRIIEQIRYELKNNSNDPHLNDIVRVSIQLVLEYCNRFYARQINKEAMGNHHVLSRFQDLLEQYYKENRQRKLGLPTVKYCARELFLSSNYFGDIIKNATGDTASHYIRNFVIERAKSLLVSGMTVSQAADELGYDYSSHFTRTFKNVTGALPSQFCLRQNH